MKMIPISKQSKSSQRKFYAAKRGSWNGVSVKCSKIVYRLCNHMVYSFDILKASQKKRKRWRWLGRKGLWK